MAYCKASEANQSLAIEDQFAFYLFTKNLQGDILNMYNEAGVKVASYTYDAWGNHTVTNHTSANIGNINPFRYRGYYYDQETGFYYLNSRYYDPEIKRFINADSMSYLGANGDLQSFNLYAYCSNNPVMNVDPNGNFVLSALIVGAIIGLAVGFGATLYEDYADDGKVFNGSVSAGDYSLNSIVSGLTGLAVGAAAPYIGAFLSSSFTFGSTVVAGGTVAVSVSGAQIVGLVAGLGMSGILLMSKPNSGRIRFSDGTGINPKTGKEFADPNEARNFYKTIKDSIKKANWKKWLKGKGWYGNHLK